MADSIGVAVVERRAQARKLLGRRQRTVDAAPQLTEVLRGTLLERYVRCGKAGCHCQEGPGHGPILYLSVTLGVGRSQQITIAPEDQKMARLLVHNYKRIWEILEEVSTINRALLQHRLLPRAAAVTASHERPRRRKRRPRRTQDP